MNYLFIDSTFEEFTSELKMLESNKLRKEKLKERLNDEFYLISGLKGANPNKTPGTTNQAYMNERKLEQLEKLTPLQNEIKRLELNIKRTEKMLSMVDEDFRNMLKDVYIENKTLNIVANERNLGNPTNVIRNMKQRYNQIKKGYSS